MATIQIREIPEDAYEAIRRRAKSHGQSIQAYMREVVIDFAFAPTKSEAIEYLEASLVGADHSWLTPDLVVDAIHADRR
ncbi:FitA-like ribbon-helix-helix domain-containing protein [Antrihabitans cavernicola]|uniref:Antitoxin n=1 Tax=Antrihabitans cavernicola TaxID=2495913 RepID=A0A5A7SAZ8_9NOCA|nr:antitoxin [Spelaeibacter cavernicola]KAA0022332.1 antitoxin [Spelaeibacter cavernicola]